MSTNFSTSGSSISALAMSSSVTEAFKGLNVASAQDVSDHEAIFEVSYQYLSKVRDFKDVKAFHNCIVSLINSEKYYKALDFLKEVPAEIHDEFPLEKAYVYYKTGNLQELEKIYSATLSSGAASEVASRALKHVMAQAYYQNGKIPQALDFYHQLISSNSVDNELDMACNERAVLSQLALTAHSFPKPLTSVAAAELTYDIVFNESLVELAKNDLASSLQLLEKAQSMCQEQNMDLDAADLALELAPIKLTIAYIYQLSDKSEQALEELKSIDLSNVSDLLPKLIFSTNYISLVDPEANANFPSRELNYQKNLHKLRHKLTKSQYQVLLKNHLLLSYMTETLNKTSTYFSNKFNQSFQEDFIGDVSPLVYKVLVKTGITLEDLSSEEHQKTIARKVLRFALAELDKSGASMTAVAAALLLVHINSRISKYDQAITVLEKLTSLELAAGGKDLHASVFGVLINLYEVTNGSRKLNAFYETLIEKFQSLPTESLQSNSSLYGFVRAIAFKLLGIGATEKSQPLLARLLEAQPEDSLVQSVVNGDTSGLMSVEELASKTDVEELLAADVSELVPSAAAAAKSTFSAGKKKYRVSKKAHKPKFSKTKVVKPEAEFDADALDKERWIPMKLRSYYKPSKKELKKKSGGHQGAVESSPAPVSAPAPSKNKNAKKKKKGKK